MKNPTSLFLLFSLSLGTLFGQQSFEFAYSTGRNDQARAVTQCKDKGYAVIGSTVNYSSSTDLYLMKTDQNGIFEWAKRMGGLGLDGGEDIIQLSDSGFGIVGYSQSNGNYDLFFVRTDKQGDTLFTKLIGGSDWDFGYSLQSTSDKGFILAGSSAVNGKSKAYLVKLDSLGNMLWKKTFGGSQESVFEDLIILASGDYLMAGYSTSFGNAKQAYLVKTDTNGNLIWQANYGNPGEDFAKSVTELNTGELVFSGATNTIPYPDLDGWAVKVSSTGTLIQQEIVYDYTATTPVVQNDDWNQFVITHNDSLVIGGTRSYESSEEGNVFLYRYSQNISFPSGFVSDFQKFVSRGKDIAYDAKVTSDNGLIIACTGEFFDTSQASIYLIKLDSTLDWPLPFFNSISFQNDYTTVAEREKADHFEIFPNPASDYFKLLFTENKGESILTVFTKEGKIVYNEKINNRARINTDFWESGIYVVRLQTEEGIFSKKIVITR